MRRDAALEAPQRHLLCPLRATVGGLIKIGWAVDVSVRLAKLQACSPLALIVLHSEPGNGREERSLHTRFAATRRHGEWFEDSAELLAYIEERRLCSHNKIYEPAESPPTRFVLDPQPAPKLAKAEPTVEWERLVAISKILE